MTPPVNDFNPSSSPNLANPRARQTAPPSKVQSFFWNFFKHLSVERKISLGYALSLAIAFLGTSVGVFFSHYLENRTERLAEAEHTLGETLNTLETQTLHIRLKHQQLILLTDSPQRFETKHKELAQHSQVARDALSKLETLEIVTLNSFLRQQMQMHRQTFEAYTNQLDQVLSGASQQNPSRLREVGQRLAAASQSQTTIATDGMLSQLHALEKQAFEQEAMAESRLEEAQRFRQMIVLLGILGSGAVAGFLAMLISQSIAYPLSQVTRVAKRVTKESNFDLTVPVTRSDEIGVLADALNQLIQRVKGLLQEQKAEANRQLLQSEKMSSLGRTLAGVAHEINNPVNFIYGNLRHLETYLEDLLRLVEAYEQKFTDPAIQKLQNEIELEFLKEDLPKTLNSIQIGAERARQIVLSLKSFSRLDDTEPHAVNLHECLDSTLLILNSRIKKGIEIVRDYGNPCAIVGFSGSLHQVFMNLLSNAIDALEEAEAGNPALFQGDRSPEIVIRTVALEGDRIQVSIHDNGSGISAENQAKIFETFFTTKPVGVGTGLGLSISREIVEEKHGGQLSFKSEEGKGTTFFVTLPIKQSSARKPTPVSA